MNPSASSLERADECPDSLALVQVNKITRDGDRGSSIHAFVRRVLVGMPIDHALAHVAVEYRDTCRAIDFKSVGADLTGLRAEVAYAWDVKCRSVRELGQNIARNYGELGPAEVPGTNDVEGFRFDDMPCVIDVKTGQLVTPCVDNLQMKFHALVRMYLTGAREVDARILYVREDGKVKTDSWVFDSFSLDAFADELEEIVDEVNAARERIARGEVRVSPGHHCQYCPALAACPAHVTFARAMVQDLSAITQGTIDEELVRERLRALSPQQRGMAYAKGTQAKTILTVLLDGLKMLAKQDAFPLPDGRLVKAISFAREDFSRPAAIEMLRAKGATEEEIQSLFKDHTVEQVRVVGRKPRRGKAA